MNIECTDYKEFFDAFNDAVDETAGDGIVIESNPMSLKIGFTVNGEDTYWARIRELKYAKDANYEGVDYYVNLLNLAQIIK